MSRRSNTECRNSNGCYMEKEKEPLSVLEGKKKETLTETKNAFISFQSFHLKGSNYWSWDEMKWLFVFFLVIIFVVSVKCDNQFNGTGWAYSVTYQDESCTTPISASGITTSNCPPNYNPDLCVNKTITSCVSSPTVHLPSNFAVL